MAKVWLAKDEWFPVFIVDDEGPGGGSDPVEIEDAELAEIRRVFAEFGRVQERLAGIFDAWAKHLSRKQP